LQNRRGIPLCTAKSLPQFAQRTVVGVLWRNSSRWAFQYARRQSSEQYFFGFVALGVTGLPQ
jgi:hypothetical protein